MNEKENSSIGKIVWHDLTVDNADSVKDFYCKVVGWSSSEHDMGEYNDHNINLQSSGETVAGICNARGSNAKIPPQWLLYVNVSNVQESAQLCIELGGKVIDGPRKMGKSDFCIIEDPAGAVLALISA